MKTIIEMFAECVQRSPHQRAVTFQGTSLTYEELERRVDALACVLVKRGVNAGEPVAIRVEPSVDMVIAMLGVLRAGACYLPIDVELPIERVRYLLDDSGARFLIGSDAFGGRLVDPNALEDAGEVALPRVSPSDCAYLVYTSGTTGNPKGVLIEHCSLANYVRWFREQYGIDGSHTAALLTSYAYDLGYTALWTTILSGGHLHLLPRSIAEDAAAVARYFRDHRVTFIKVTPSLLGALIRSRDFDRASCASLRLIVTGGERIRSADLETIYARLPEVLVVNHYGPTETTIGATTFPVERAQLAEFSRCPVIGRPIGNARAYVVTPELQPCPIGATGELLIGGLGVARGYHRRDDLTREKFIADPFGASGRVYRTGDLARWTTDGMLEFVGRIDRQVKVRGHRVELSEIESVMARLGLSETVVVERNLGESNRALCAYYVDRAHRDSSELRASLGRILPDYMVPAWFVRLDALPRTANGKLDVDRLPDPIFAPAHDPPITETERIVLQMWSEALGVDAHSLGVTQNFFEVGGQSLLMIQLLAEIDNRFQRSLPISVFYREGTIRAIARLLDRQLSHA